MLVSLVKRGAGHVLVADVMAAGGQRSKLTWAGHRQLSLPGPQAMAIKVLSPLRLMIIAPNFKVYVSQGLYQKKTGELGGDVSGTVGVPPG